MTWHLWASQGPKAYLWISLLSSDSVLHPLGKAAPLVSSLIRWTNCTALGPFSSIFHLLVSSQFFSNKPITKSCLRTKGHVLLLQILSPITSLGLLCCPVQPSCGPAWYMVSTAQAASICGQWISANLFWYCWVPCVQPFRVEDLSFPDRVNKKLSEQCPKQPSV